MIKLILNALEYGISRLGLSSDFSVTEGSDGLHTLDLNKVTVQARRASGSQALSIGSNNITYDTEDVDSANALTIGTGVFIAPRDGFYMVNFIGRVAAASGLIVSNSCDVSFNSVFSGTILGMLNTATEQYFEVSRAGFLSQGQEVHARINLNGGSSPVCTSARLTIVYVPGT